MYDPNSMNGKSDIAAAICPPMSMNFGDSAPEWVHLLPTGSLRAVDGRAPYAVKSFQAIAAVSLPAGGRLPIDECNAIDRAQALAGPAPARGWIVELQAREDGLWGRVEWTPTGQQMIQEKAYVAISPVILHTQAGEVIQVLRASLSNPANLTPLPSEAACAIVLIFGLDGHLSHCAAQGARNRVTPPLNPSQIHSRGNSVAGSVITPATHALVPL